MRSTTRGSLVAALAALAATASTSPASAGIWTEIPSGTTAEITAIEYQSATRFWFTTSTGEIWRRRADLSGFERVRPATFVPLNDIEFQAGGNVGLAVGDGGTVVRSTDGGASWSAVTGITASNLGDGSGNKCTIATSLRDVNFVRFAGDARVWIGSDERQLAVSRSGTAATVGAIGTWVDANRKVPPVARDNCWIEQSSGFADMFVTPNPNVFYIGIPSADQAVYSVDNLASVPLTKPAEIANGFTTAGTMAGDPANPNRVWAVSPGPYSSSTAQYTEDGYASSHWFRLVNADSHPWPTNGPYDVDFAGGTVLAAGNGGFVIHSLNGRDFFWNGADGALAAHDWRAVALASGSDGAIGGAGGRLAVTAAANVTPDLIVPRGTISGPSSVTVGEPATFTLHPIDEGGSGLNPASYGWTATALPGQSGGVATYVFPSTGAYVVTATFADNAGNRGSVARTVFVRAATRAPVTRPPTTRPPGTPGRGGGTAGPGPLAPLRASAQVVGRRVRVRVNGSVRVRRGVRLARACRGSVAITLAKRVGRRGRRMTTLKRARARLAVRRGACRYTKVVFVPRSSVGPIRRLQLTVRFPGNRRLSAGRRTTQLVITR